jgi:putative nucleotidyltransferase with HDIG domain
MSAAQSRAGFWELLLRFFGLAGAATVEIADAATEAEQAAPERIVIAPGGYRIRVPQPTDVNQDVGDMLPSVRQGLSVVPPLPKIVIDLLQAIQDPNSSAASVAAIAASDPALATSLIRAVNAASVGMARKISSVGEAVSYLGFAAVKAMVVRLRLEDMLAVSDPQALADSEDLWAHSLVASQAAACLARRVPGSDAGFASTLGLLHDIGKLAVLAYLPNESHALQASNSDADALQREISALGTNHATIGAMLAAKWSLPADLVQAIRFHHAPHQTFHATDPLALRQAVAIAHIANQLAKYCFAHADRVEIDQVSDESFALLGLPPSLPDLLDDQMCGVIGRAVLLADANTRRPLTAPRRFLRLLSGEDAQSAARNPLPSLRVCMDDAAIAAAFAEEIPLIDLAPRAQAVRCQATVDDKSITAAIGALRQHQDQMNTSTDARSTVALLTRALLPNLLQIAKPGEAIEVSQSCEAERITWALRCDALATGRRLNRPPAGDEALRLCETELANVLNLQWFGMICVNGDGSAILFQTR